MVTIYVNKFALSLSLSLIFAFYMDMHVVHYLMCLVLIETVLNFKAESLI